VKLQTLVNKKIDYFYFAELSKIGKVIILVSEYMSKLERVAK